MAMAENVICVGASGAIFGAVGAMLTVVVVNHGRVENFTFPRLIIYVVLSIYLGFMSQGVSLSAHLGGLATGFSQHCFYIEREVLIHENKHLLWR